jgi:hypothetical protein
MWWRRPIVFLLLERTHLMPNHDAQPLEDLAPPRDVDAEVRSLLLRLLRLVAVEIAKELLAQNNLAPSQKAGSTTDAPFDEDELGPASSP